MNNTVVEPPTPPLLFVVLVVGNNLCTPGICKTTETSSIRHLFGFGGWVCGSPPILSLFGFSEMSDNCRPPLMEARSHPVLLKARACVLSFLTAIMGRQVKSICRDCRNAADHGRSSKNRSLYSSPMHCVLVRLRCACVFKHCLFFA